MTLYILDTDHISLFLGNYLSVRDRVLQNEATIVTRNKRDFEQVPKLTIEDWS